MIAMKPLMMDQHMLVDSRIRDLLILSCELQPDDIVLEIGPGEGFITNQLALASNKIIAIEQDHRFDDSLSKLHLAVKIIYGNALEIFDRVVVTKVVANLPFSISEPFIKKLLKKNIECASLIVSLHFFDLISSPSPANSKWALMMPLFYSVEKICDVPKTSFSPKPRVKTVLMKLTRRPGPFTISESILRDLILKDDKLVKNAITIAIKIRIACTKWQAKQMFLSLRIPKQLHSKRVDHLSNRQFGIVSAKITSTPLFK